MYRLVYVCAILLVSICTPNTDIGRGPTCQWPIIMCKLSSVKPLRLHSMHFTCAFLFIHLRPSVSLKFGILFCWSCKTICEVAKQSGLTHCSEQQGFVLKLGSFCQVLDAYQQTCKGLASLAMQGRFFMLLSSCPGVTLIFQKLSQPVRMQDWLMKLSAAINIQCVKSMQNREAAQSYYSFRRLATRE